MRESLDAIALACGADKSSACHGYAAIYEPWFAPLRDQPITLLEIGVAGGHSLRMWDRFFSHPNARIFGLDNNPLCVSELRGVSDRVRAADLDATDRKAVEIWYVHRILRRCAVIIDDGSHRWADQQKSFSTFWPCVAPGGQYWIEDLHTSYWASHSGAAYSTIDRLKQLVDDVNMRGKPLEGKDCRADRNAVLSWAATEMERTVAEVHFWKGLALVVKQCS